MTPGIYDIENDDYHRNSAISRSNIMDFKKSPFHFYNRKKLPRKSSGQQMFGSALHTMILEPEKFPDTYFVAPNLNKNTNEWKKIKQEAAEMNKCVITENQFDELFLFSEAIRLDPTASELIKDAQYEKSIFWENPETGILCKCRPDILQPNFICDLKTAADASERAFKAAVYDYGYHIQAAMMQEGVKAVFGHTINDFVFIVIEKSECMATAIYTLDEDAIAKGREDFHATLKQYKECLEKNEWPGYPIKSISLPRYAYAI